MKNSNHSRRPKLPATMKEALAAGWHAVGDESTITSNERIQEGTQTMEHEDFPGLYLKIRFRAVRTFGRTRFEGRVHTREEWNSHQKKLDETCKLIFAGNAGDATAPAA